MCPFSDHPLHFCLHQGIKGLNLGIVIGHICHLVFAYAVFLAVQGVDSVVSEEGPFDNCRHTAIAFDSVGVIEELHALGTPDNGHGLKEHAGAYRRI